MALEEICFITTTFWVHIKSLPLQFMTKTNVDMIGKLFSSLLRYESFTRTNIISTKYLRLQIWEKGGKWISFQYERLPEFCFICGLLGHVGKNCLATEVEKHEILRDLYAPWLKAEAEAAFLIRDGECLRQVDN